MRSPPRREAQGSAAHCAVHCALQKYGRKSAMADTGANTPASRFRNASRPKTGDRSQLLDLRSPEREGNGTHRDKSLPTQSLLSNSRAKATRRQARFRRRKLDCLRTEMGNSETTRRRETTTSLQRPTRGRRNSKTAASAKATQAQDGEGRENGTRRLSFDSITGPCRPLSACKCLICWEYLTCERLVKPRRPAPR